jgi:uncharacterized protein YjiS (DUF1127 family)
MRSQPKEPVMSGKIFTGDATGKSATWKIAARLVASTILSVARATLKAVANRNSVRTLAELDDRMLADIGLTRGDVDGALAAPWHRDPTRILTVKRLENRVRRRSPGHPPVMSQACEEASLRVRAKDHTS